MDPPYEGVRMATAGRKLEEMAKLAIMMEEEGVSSDHMKQMWAGQSNILVAVRVRPLLKHDVVKKSCVRVVDSNVVCIMDPAAAADKVDILRANRTREKQYAFDYVFEPGSSQDSVFHHTTKFLIHGVLDGYNATVFAYGQTGSGKTHTMIGNPSDPGIMVRVMADLFTHSDKEGKRQGIQYKVTVSFLEVYNENIRDLLSDVEEYLDLREDPIKGPTVSGITEVEATTSKEIMELLQQGNYRRAQQATAANEVSSRSHAVLQVVVEGKDKASGIVANIKVGKLSLVDLAGSERAANTQNRGARLVEGANINRSLLALGNCINALGEKGNKGNFVPYRDSKLTRLLKDSLGGNCRTVMIANISAAESSFEETLNTLKYANRAKNIKTNVQRNVLNVNHHISEYVHLIDNLRGEIQALKNQIGVQHDRHGSAHGVRGSLQALGSPVVGRGGHPSTPLQVLRDSMKSAASLSERQGEGRELVNNMRQKIVENFQERMQLRRSLIELEDQNVQNSIEVSKRQLIVVTWSESRGMTPGRSKQENKDDFSSHLLTSANPEIREAWLECEQIRKAIIKNNSMKKNIAKRLRQNEREAESTRKELNDKVTGEDRRELMELQYQVGRLELENMELEQHRMVHESIVKGKDLTIQKLMLQLAVRDKLIQRQQTILVDNNLDGKVGYAQLALMEQTLMGDVDTAPPSPPRSINEMNMTDESNQGANKRSPFVPLLNVSSVTNAHTDFYDEEDDDDEPPLTDIREVILSSRDRGAFEAGDWSEIRSELSDSPTRSPFESRKGANSQNSRHLNEMPASNTNSANSFASQEPNNSKGVRHQGGGVRASRQYVASDPSLGVFGMGQGEGQLRGTKIESKQAMGGGGRRLTSHPDVDEDIENLDPPASGRRLLPLHGGGAVAYNSNYEDPAVDRKEDPGRRQHQAQRKAQFDSRFDGKRASNGPTISNVLATISPRGQKQPSNALHHVSSLSKVSGQEGDPLSARRNVLSHNPVISLSVAGRGNSMQAMNPALQAANRAPNGKAKQLMKDVEDLYAGYLGKGNNYDKKDAIIDNKKKVDDSFVDDEFGDESVDTIMSDNSDHSEPTPRGEGVYRRRQNGPRGYGQGQGKIASKHNQGGVAPAAKPLKYKIQGGQRPLKISVKASDGSNLSKGENIGILIAQAYPSSVSVQLNADGRPQGDGGSSLGPVLLPVDKANSNVGRNRSLPTLQQKQNAAQYSHS